MKSETVRNSKKTSPPGAKKLPTSGSETPYTPGMFPRRKGNCYSFALNEATPDEKLQPGNLASNRDRRSPAMSRDPASSCAAIAAQMRLDSKGSGRSYESNATSKCRAGYYKIATVLAPGSDFHYYRQVGDVSFRPARGATRASISEAFGVPVSGVTVRRTGMATVRRPGVWAHKRGLATGALLGDSCGKPIKDPRKACRDYGNLDYKKFCGFWCVLAKKRAAAGAKKRKTPTARASTGTRAGRS